MNYALVALDATGSMAGKSVAVADAMNEYAATLPGDTHLSVFMFDSERWLSYYAGDAKDYPKMKPEDHVPGAMTPLYDRCAQLVAHGESLAKPGDRVMVMVDTDGMENCSKEHNQDSIRALVETKIWEGWAFLFMSEGLDRAEAERNARAGRAAGMPVQIADVKSRGANYRAAAKQTIKYLHTGKMPMDADNAAQEDLTGQREDGRAAPYAESRNNPWPPGNRRMPREAKPWKPAGRAAPAGDGRR